MLHGKSYASMSAEEKKYHTEDDVRTLVQAGEIKKDKAAYEQ